MNAAIFGIAAILSLGVVAPLQVVDSVLGGDNNWNLVSSCLTVASFWFFRDAVTSFIGPDVPRHRKRLLLVLLACIAVPFFLIADRSETDAHFMANHAEQVWSLVYNIVYMCVLGWIVGGMVLSLRRHVLDRYTAFLIGLGVVWVSCIDEILYVLLAFFVPGPASDGPYFMFYVLFFGGILIVASGWGWVIVRERDWAGQLKWRGRSAVLVAMLWRVRRRAKSNVSREAAVVPVVRRPMNAPDLSRPRLLVMEYRAPHDSGRPLSVVPVETAADVMRVVLHSNSEDGAYRLVVQVRNTSLRLGVNLSASEEKRLGRVEQLFPGY